MQIHIYNPLCRLSKIGTKNDDGKGIDFYFTRTYTSSDATISFWGENQPYQKWVAITRHYSPNGVNMSETGHVKDYNWDHVVIAYNTCLAPTSDYSKMRSIAGHEIGHAIGLDHHQSDNGVLMYQGYRERTAIVPSSYDIRAAIFVYTYTIW